MFRLLCTTACVTVALLATATAVSWIQQGRERARSLSLVTARAANLATERERWSAAQGAADHITAEEARRTLDLLQALYVQEDRLWRYYDAVSRSALARSRLAEERARLEADLARRANDLEHLERQVDHLRPAIELSSLSFTTHRPNALERSLP